MNVRNKFRKVVSKCKGVARKASAVGTGLLVSGAAFAGGGGDLDAASTAITAQQALALGIVVLGTVAILVIRYSKLARRA